MEDDRDVAFLSLFDAFHSRAAAHNHQGELRFLSKIWKLRNIHSAHVCDEEKLPPPPCQTTKFGGSAKFDFRTRNYAFIRGLQRFLPGCMSGQTLRYFWAWEMTLEGTFGCWWFLLKIFEQLYFHSYKYCDKLTVSWSTYLLFWK